MTRFWLPLALGLWLAAPAAARAQIVSQRGFVEGRVFVYPQTAAGDDRQAGTDLLVRYEPSARPWSWLTLAASIDARLDTFGQVDRQWRISFLDRTRTRPALGVRRASVALTGGGASLEIGRQFIRWGRADVLSPTDRFAPRDLVDVVVDEFLAVTGARLTVERDVGTLDVAWVPYFTPSRLPLAGRRWAPQPKVTELVATTDGGDAYPGGSQVGVRWSQMIRGAEYALAFYEGYDHLPLFDGRFKLDPPRFEIVRVYPRLRMYGADAAWPAPWFTVKGEAASFRSPDARADEYVLYVVQIERQLGEWFLVGGYAGEVVTASRATAKFAADRGLARSVLGRASLTIDSNRSMALQGVVRQDGRAVWIEGEYSQAAGQHWRVTARVDVIRGDDDDFLGQYRRNSHVTVTVRYSF